MNIVLAIIAIVIFLGSVALMLSGNRHVKDGAALGFAFALFAIALAGVAYTHDSDTATKTQVLCTTGEKPPGFDPDTMKCA